MKAADLAAFIERPEAHRAILGSYRGAYSLSIGRSPTSPSEFALHLRVQADPTEFPHQVRINENWVELVVKSGFRCPVAN